MSEIETAAREILQGNLEMLRSNNTSLTETEIVAILRKHFSTPAATVGETSLGVRAVSQIRDKLNSIIALCENPHWTADRKQRISQLASECITLLLQPPETPTNNWMHTATRLRENLVHYRKGCNFQADDTKRIAEYLRAAFEQGQSRLSGEQD